MIEVAFLAELDKAKQGFLALRREKASKLSVKMAENMNWHNDTNGQLKKFHVYKRDFYKEMRSYF